MHPKHRPFENIVGKRENADNSIFLFPQYFLSYERQILCFRYHLLLKNAVILEKAKILSSDKKLNSVLQEAFLNILEKGRQCKEHIHISPKIPL